MTVLFGHPGGNPNSHQAALAHFQAGWLEEFCVPWMPSPRSLKLMGALPSLRSMSARLARRYFPPLAAAPKRQGRLAEMRRLALRALGRGDERLSYEANDWLMRTMTREVRRKQVTAVHSYEDCSLWQFEAAKGAGKACIYDMPIGYYPAWQQTEAALAKKYAEWLPAGGLPSNRYVRPEQKKAEMALADLVFVPSSFVERTVKDYCPGKAVARAPYGVDLEFWTSQPKASSPAPLTFIHAGQISIRKGIPDLLLAWERAGLNDAQLLLVGSWYLSEGKRRDLPKGVVWHRPCAQAGLRELYRSADVFVMPSHFEGFGLVLLEAMACGLPAIASDATAGPDLMDETAGRLITRGNIDALVEALRWSSDNRDRLPAMGCAARAQAEHCTWGAYRQTVRDAIAPFV